MSNVDIVSEGFDVPDTEAVQLARPTKSLVLYLQQVGRCMGPAAGKEFGLVLDNAGLWLEHGLSYVDRDWSLHGDKKRMNFLH
jgi:superfamily II DNA or RNA helicase